MGLYKILIISALMLTGCATTVTVEPRGCVANGRYGNGDVLVECEVIVNDQCQGVRYRVDPKTHSVKLINSYTDCEGHSSPIER